MSKQGQYSQALETLRASRDDGQLPIRVGLSATPYRNDGYGYLWEAPGSVWSGLAGEVDMLSLVEDGYLAPVRTVSPETAQIDVSSLHDPGGGRDFTGKSHEEVMDTVLLEGIARGAVDQLRAERRRGLMVFTPTINVTEEMAEILRGLGVSTVSVTSDHYTRDRDRALGAFRSGQAEAIVSCGVLTEGFDAPHVDLIVVARATKSPGLWVQITGRGSRTCEGKADCVIRDHGGNAARHGPINAVQPQRWAKRGPRASDKRDGDGDPLFSAEEAALSQLDMNPSRARMMVGLETDGEPDWQRVVGAEVTRKTSEAGNDLAVVALDLEGKPARVWESLILSKGKRTYAGRRFSRLCGQPLSGDRDADFEVARAAARRVRRVSLEMDGRWPRIRYIESAAGR